MTEPHSTGPAPPLLRRGAATLPKTAIVLPMMLLFLFGILEYSRYVMLLQVMNNAAREGCRYAVMHTNPVVITGVTYGNAESDVKTLVSNCLAGQALSGQAVTVYGSDRLGNNNGTTWQNTQSGQWITVKITGNFISVLPTFLAHGEYDADHGGIGHAKRKQLDGQREVNVHAHRLIDDRNETAMVLVVFVLTLIVLFSFLALGDRLGSDRDGSHSMPGGRRLGGDGRRPHAQRLRRETTTATPRRRPSSRPRTTRFSANR